MSDPRLPPLADAEMSTEQREAVRPFVRPDGLLHNVFRTMGHHPEALKRWTPFVRHVLVSTLPQRETELLILRVAVLRDCEYAWAQHVRIARRAGLSDSQILATRDGPSAPGWTPAEAALLQAADDLVRDACISESAWAALTLTHSEVQRLDVILTVGQYDLACMVLKTCAVQIDSDLADDPPLVMA